MTRQQDDPILEAYIEETSQLVEQLEDIILTCEGTKNIAPDIINEIFRVMHTIKGSSSMMNFNNIATLAHSLEDLFAFYRSDNRWMTLDWSMLSDVLLQGVDFFKLELYKVKSGDPVDGDATAIIGDVKRLLQTIAQQQESAQANDKSAGKALNRFKVHITFADDCGMENVRAFQIVHRLEDVVDHYRHIPEDILQEEAADKIRLDGFHLWITTYLGETEIYDNITQSSCLKHVDLHRLTDDEESSAEQAHEPVPESSHDHDHEQEHAKEQEKDEHPASAEERTESQAAQHAQDVNLHLGRAQGKTITVNVDKLDELMDLVGELVLAEAMVTQNPDLNGLNLEQFHKAAQHLQKIIKEIQDKVMEIRMVPLSMTFQRMHRVVRDMSKKMDKNVRLVLVGEDTEVDKNIIEHLNDPLMHLVRNAIDHGIEDAPERAAAGKSETATLTLEAQNIGGDVLIIVKDDGRGLQKESILRKAREKQLLHKSESEMTDKEIYNLIFLPGFSTKESITEYSGRGVGMDVVVQKIAAVGGTVSVDSVPGKGTVFTIKIPLTLAIIDGMNARVGDSKYTIPTNSIIESFRPQSNEVITDPSGNEMIMVRGNCYPIIRLHERYRVQTDIVKLTDGVLIMVDQDGNRACVFVDELLGQQQVVVKALPEYIRKFYSVEGISGCTLLGDGDISLILDVRGLMRMNI